MNIVIAPDSYKGSLTAPQVCRIVTRAFEEVIPRIRTVSVPLADGGEGTLEALLDALKGTKHEAPVTGPLGLPVSASFGVVTDARDGSKLAVLESALVVGLTMVPSEQRNPLNATSRGIGELITRVLDLGIRSLLIGIGGTAVNDGGIGLLAALGVVFVNKEGAALEGFGRDLPHIASIDTSGLDPRLAECRIAVASDVTNPLVGPNGATFVFGPQKGASPEMASLLDAAMDAYAERLEQALPGRHRETPGAGAAGGIGYALLMLGGELSSGAKLVAEAAGLGRHIASADFVLTGEGCSDKQTRFGKLPMFVAEAARKSGKPAILLSGSLGDGWEELLPAYAGCFAATAAPASVEECLRNAEPNLYRMAKSIAHMLRAWPR